MIHTITKSAQGSLIPGRHNSEQRVLQDKRAYHTDIQKDRKQNIHNQWIDIMSAANPEE